MTASVIISGISAVLGVLREWLHLRRRPAPPTPAQQAAQDVHAARAASAQGNATAINAQAEQHRVRKALCLLLLSGLLISGCGGCGTLKRLVSPVPDPPAPLIPAVVVVSADRYQYPMTNSAGISGWFVPAAVHAEMMEAITLVDYYRSLNTTKGTTP